MNHGFLIIREEDVLENLEAKPKLRVTDAEPREPLSTTQVWKPHTEAHGQQNALCYASWLAPQDFHVHRETQEIYRVVEGKMAVVLRDILDESWNLFYLNKGTSIVIQPGIWHKVQLIRGGVLSVIQSPSGGEDKYVADIEMDEEADALLRNMVVSLVSNKGLGSGNPIT